MQFYLYFLFLLQIRCYSIYYFLYLGFKSLIRIEQSQLGYLNIGSMFANDVEKNAETFKTNVENILDANLNLLIFSSYIETAFSIIKNIDNNVSIKNIIKTARLVFIKDFSIRRLPLLKVKSALDKFEKEVKDSEEFKTKILEEYCCVIIENHKGS